MGKYGKANLFFYLFIYMPLIYFYIILLLCVFLFIHMYLIYFYYIFLLYVFIYLYVFNLR